MTEYQWAAMNWPAAVRSALPRSWRTSLERWELGQKARLKLLSPCRTSLFTFRRTARQPPERVSTVNPAKSREVIRWRGRDRRSRPAVLRNAKPAEGDHS